MTTCGVINATEPEDLERDTSKVQWPDFEAQRRAIFGDRLLPEGTIQELMDEERGDH